MKMRSLYLILATTAVVVTCEPQHTNNDIIWYPVDDDDGVFISIYGEKRRTSHNANWRSHRRARYSGMEHPSPLPLSFDPTENRDPSFFHNINERRPLIPVPPIPNVPPSFQNQQFPVKRPNKRPQGQASPAENFQDIFNEVFDYNKYPPVNENTGNRPGTINQWGNRPESTSQWFDPSNANPSAIQRPGNQWETTSRPSIQRPNFSSQQGNSRPSRPTNSEWINTNRPTSQSDKLIFPDEFSLSTSLTTSSTTATPSNLVPTDPPTMSPCERMCPVTPQFNPVCGTDGVTYTNVGRLKCANMCGKNVRLSHYGNCGRTTLVTPLVSNRPKQKLRGFWLVDN